MAEIFHWASGHGLNTLIGVVAGGLIAWAFGRWKRMKEHQSILQGDARDTIVIHHHLLESSNPIGSAGPTTALRIRALGQAEMTRVVPNGHLASVFLHRAVQVSTHNTLISMEGAEGSYLLETLTGFVCDRVANGPFEHDLYIMAPCCEPHELAQFQPITLLLIAVADLKHFESWAHCRKLRVEHASDAARILTLMALAQRFRAEQAAIAQLREARKRTKHVETMYILDLALDKRSAPIPTREVPWDRFERVLKKMGLA